jgi:hypothetical protein
MFLVPNMQAYDVVALRCRGSTGSAELNFQEAIYAHVLRIVAQMKPVCVNTLQTGLLTGVAGRITVRQHNVCKALLMSTAATHT